MTCVCCGNPEFDKHHVKSRGSGGGDEDENLLNLCRLCHIRIHKVGLVKMVKLYPQVEGILKEKGWSFCETRKKWVRN